VDRGGPSTSSPAGKHAVAGKGHTCAIRDGGRVKCWGNNSIGQLGLALGSAGGGGDPQPDVAKLSPLDLNGSVAVALALGGEHSCALLDDGGVKCWGGNSLGGQLGLGGAFGSVGLDQGSMGDKLPKVELGAKAVALSAGDMHTCALLEDGNAKCWGNNNGGQLGMASSDNYFEPGLPINAGGAKFKSISAGLRFTCAVFDNGSVKCWGDNVRGQLGAGDKVERGNKAGETVASLPAVDLGGPAIAVSAGTYHACAILQDGGKVKCWGNNTDGQLGVGDMDDRGDDPNEMGANLKVTELDGAATQIITGNSFTCALLTGGKVKCWGYNQYGVVGLGEPGNRGSKPNEMGANLPALQLPAIKYLSTRETHICATAAENGDVHCWGENQYGQLGYGDRETRRLVGPKTPPVTFE